MKVSILCCLCFFSYCQSISAQLITLDSTFGNDGKVLHSFDLFSDTSRAVVVQDDGKILVCGRNDFAISGNVYLARYDSDGSLDSGFGNNGIVVTPLTTESAGVRIMKLLPDGKILVTSSKSISNNVNFFDFATMRFDADGTIDPTFGTNGMVQTDINGAGNYANAIDIQSDGKIIVAGGTYINSNANVTTTLVRYQPNGTIDATFGINGKIILNLLAPSSSQYVWDIKVLSDDSILLGVNTTAFETVEVFRNIAILKLNSNGTPDASFGTNGSVLTDFGGQDILYAIDEYQDGIFMAGYSRYPGFSIILSKYLPSGVLDTTFGDQGKVKTNKDAGSLADGLLGMKVLPNGKILCSGWTGEAEAKDALLIRFNPDGSIDNSFNQTGYITTDFDNAENSNFSFAIQGDGKIVCSGWATVGGYQDSTLVRYDVETLATNQFNSENHFSVFPNPFTDRINVSIALDASQNLSADLVDNRGRKIQNLLRDKLFASGQYVVEFPLSESLSKGVYFIKIFGALTSTTLKIIK